MSYPYDVVNVIITCYIVNFFFVKWQFKALIDAKLEKKKKSKTKNEENDLID